MIKIEKTEVVGWEHAIRGMRNAKNSWDRSDSYFLDMDGDMYDINGNHAPFYGDDNGNGDFIGPNDHKLMMQLANGGPVHAKYRRYIDVYVDITAPLYWWKEFDTYRTAFAPNPFDIEMNSCSTMHKIHDKEFTIEDFSCEHLTPRNREHLLETIDILNDMRDWYLKYDHISDRDRENFDPSIEDKKDLWWQMIQLLPSSYNQKRTVKFTYETLANIYPDRRFHKLDCWRILCKWIEELPYSEIITGPKLLEKKMNLPEKDKE